MEDDVISIGSIDDANVYCKGNENIIEIRKTVKKILKFITWKISLNYKKSTCASSSL